MPRQSFCLDVSGLVRGLDAERPKGADFLDDGIASILAGISRFRCAAWFRGVLSGSCAAGSSIGRNSGSARGTCLRHARARPLAALVHAAQLSARHDGLQLGQQCPQVVGVPCVEATFAAQHAVRVDEALQVPRLYAFDPRS